MLTKNIILSPTYIEVLLDARLTVYLIPCEERQLTEYNYELAAMLQCI